VLAQLARAAGERRLMVYSTREAEQAELTATAVGGTLPDAAGPYAYVVVNNSSGGKMDYYLERSVSYVGGACSGGQRNSTLTISFGNAARSVDQLPDYVTQWLGSDAAGNPRPRGLIVLRASVYGPRGATFTGVTVDGKPTSVSVGQADGRPVWSFPVAIRPGQRQRTAFELVEPASGSTPVIPVQPLVTGQRTAMRMAPCR
jgi:hypothetical protein